MEDSAAEGLCTRRMAQVSAGQGLSLNAEPLAVLNAVPKTNCLVCWCKGRADNC
jgi:hypothetical protein